MWLSWRPVGDVGELADTCTLMKLAVNKTVRHSMGCSPSSGLVHIHGATLALPSVGFCTQAGAYLFFHVCAGGQTAAAVDLHY